ncbi:type IIL restriction-modification enzyme MmeI, partial [Pseudorhodobacter sp.]|uniref:type IIL restriction-modification enzyme MmeI n=1 Tax=Pseudorhodobacter sp. TaxID=1934400 RepID=UPI00265191DD|nr:class I SAM-dependent DNA methyltransferase [Pseudorhodobacter sp.]
YRNGRDLNQSNRDFWLIDMLGLSASDVQNQYPEVFQHLLDKVKPERDQNRRPSLKNKWWLFAEPRKMIRPALAPLGRYIATVETSKHRMFQFLETTILPDHMLIAIAINEPAILSVLSSKFHVVWALKAGGTLEDRPRYNKSLCLDPFPFPTHTDSQKTQLRSLGEQLDAHRKAQQAAHPKLTLTAMYNVLEKLRAGDRIEGKDKEIYDQGLIGILRDLHDQIDAATAAAYGWPADLSDDDILHRLVALNHERAEEEARGIIRWLRPEYQNPKGVQATKGKQVEADLGMVDKIEKAPWPKTLPEQISAVQSALRDMGEATPDQIARRFQRARAASVQPLLESLAALGQAEVTQGGRYAM